MSHTSKIAFTAFVILTLCGGMSGVTVARAQRSDAQKKEFKRRIAKNRKIVEQVRQLRNNPYAPDTGRHLDFEKIHSAIAQMSTGTEGEIATAAALKEFVSFIDSKPFSRDQVREAFDDVIKAIEAKNNGDPSVNPSELRARAVAEFKSKYMIEKPLREIRKNELSTHELNVLDSEMVLMRQMRAYAKDGIRAHHKSISENLNGISSQTEAQVVSKSQLRLGDSTRAEAASIATPSKSVSGSR